MTIEAVRRNSRLPLFLCRVPGGLCFNTDAVFLFFPPEGFGVQRPDGAVQRVRIAAVRGLTIAGRTGQPDQPEPVYLGHTATRCHPGCNTDRRTGQGSGKVRETKEYILKYLRTNGNR